MVIKKGDFIEIDYIGKIKNTGDVFDLTKRDVAKEKGIENKDADYSPKIICVGQGNVVKGLDEFLVGKEVGKKYSVDISAEEGFGKKNAKLIILVPLSVFKKEKINPFPGLQINIDGRFGIVKTVSGGRILVDFNHPLSGKDVVYEVEINKIVKDDAMKVKSIIKGLIGKDVDCSVDKGVVNVDLELPDVFKKALIDSIKSTVSSIKEVKFKEKKKSGSEQ